jgi:osmotically-inducible protein OsmY
VTLEITPHGEATLTGLLRDKALLDEAVRLVRETPGVQDVKAQVTLADTGSN